MPLDQHAQFEAEGFCEPIERSTEILVDDRGRNPRSIGRGIGFGEVHWVLLSLVGVGLRWLAFAGFRWPSFDSVGFEFFGLFRESKGSDLINPVVNKRQESVSNAWLLDCLNESDH